MKGQGKWQEARTFVFLFHLTSFLPLNLFHKLRLQLHRTDTVDFAVDIVIAIDQANIPDFRANLNDQRGTFHLQILDDRN